jgi:hypothetical protein
MKALPRPSKCTLFLTFSFINKTFLYILIVLKPIRNILRLHETRKLYIPTLTRP